MLRRRGFDVSVDALLRRNSHPSSPDSAAPAAHDAIPPTPWTRGITMTLNATVNASNPRLRARIVPKSVTGSGLSGALSHLLHRARGGVAAHHAYPARIASAVNQ